VRWDVIVTITSLTSGVETELPELRDTHERYDHVDHETDDDLKLAWTKDFVRCELL
jgi:hypothetical protein